MEWLQGFAQAIADAVNGFLGPPADFLETYVWAWPEKVPFLAVVLLATGLFVTVRLAFIQITGFRHAIDITRGVYDNPDDAGDLKHFQALTTALSATVGIGNIAGVALAIRMGGPGALFWMWVTAFFGMALKYAECTLALRYRKIHPDGSVSGGPMYYIEMGLGPRWKWMAILFAACGAISSFGGGCMNQSNTLADQVESSLGIPTFVTGLVFATLVALVIIGGIRRIGKVTAVLAPTMALLYVAGALIILTVYYKQIPGGFALIVSQAFAPESMVGGGVGSLLLTVMWGIRRGLFSNEAGQGSAPIAHATAKTTWPAREGLVASLGPFIDTLVICTMTGLVIVMTGAWMDKVEQNLNLADVEGIAATAPTDAELLSLRDARISGPDAAFEVRDGVPVGGAFVYFDSFVVDPRLVDAEGRSWTGTLSVAAEDGAVSLVGDGIAPTIQGGALLTGAPMTAHAFATGLPGGLGRVIVTLAVVLFAVSTGISWSYYGDRTVEYLLGSRAIHVYRWVFVVFFFLGSILPLKAVWTFGDVALGLMSFPNLIALVLLTGKVAQMTREYYSHDHQPYR